MKVVKFLETRIDIESPQDIFCSEYSNRLLALVKDRFVGVCYKSCFILDILEITRRSHIQCKNKDLNGGVYVDIQFKAECLIYEKGDIIHQCKIIQVTDKNIILAKSKHCSIHIKNITKLDVFKQNDIIPVIVQAARYNLFDTNIAVSSIPLIPIPKEEIYYVVSADTHNSKIHDNERNSDLIKQVEQLEDDIKKYPNKAVKFFTDILYPLKEYKKYKGFDKLDVKKLDVAENDIIFTGNRYLNESIVYRAYTADAIQFNIPKDELHIRLLLEYKKDLSILLGFLQNYDAEQIKKTTMIWSIYNKLKN